MDTKNLSIVEFAEQYKTELIKLLNEIKLENKKQELMNELKWHIENSRKNLAHSKVL